MTDPRKMAAPDEGREALLAAKPPVSVGQACDAAHEREIERLAATFDRYAEAAERGAVGDDPKWAEGRAAAYRRCARDVRDAATLPAAAQPAVPAAGNAQGVGKIEITGMLEPLLLKSATREQLEEAVQNLRAQKFKLQDELAALRAGGAKVPEGWTEALVRYNDNARSFFAIANRIATELGTHALQTNFGAFAEKTKCLLEDTHAITNEARDLLAAAPSPTGNEESK